MHSICIKITIRTYSFLADNKMKYLLAEAYVTSSVFVHDSGKWKNLSKILTVYSLRTFYLPFEHKFVFFFRPKRRKRITSKQSQKNRTRYSLKEYHSVLKEFSMEFSENTANKSKTEMSNRKSQNKQYNNLQMFFFFLNKSCTEHHSYFR